MLQLGPKPRWARGEFFIVLFFSKWRPCTLFQVITERPMDIYKILIFYIRKTIEEALDALPPALHNSGCWSDQNSNP